MTNVIRLFFLLALSFQTAASSWAISSIALRASNSFLILSLETLANSSPASERAGTDYMTYEADSMEIPGDITENETWDTASDEGLQESLHFNLVVESSETLLPRLEQWYNFFLRYGIPPPEFL